MIRDCWVKLRAKGSPIVMPKVFAVSNLSIWGQLLISNSILSTREVGHSSWWIREWLLRMEANQITEVRRICNLSTTYQILFSSMFKLFPKKNKSPQYKMINSSSACKVLKTFSNTRTLSPTLIKRSHLIKDRAVIISSSALGNLPSFKGLNKFLVLIFQTPT
jgi:hypothetical protein